MHLKSHYQYRYCSKILDKRKTEKKTESYGKYLFAGIIAASVLFAVLNFLEKDDKPKTHKWSKDVESAFLSNCVNKYSNEFGKDTTKIRLTVDFCSCMLEKIKTKYEESEMENVTDAEIKEWDRQCRAGIMNQNQPR